MFDRFFEYMLAFDLPVLRFFNVTLANPVLDQFWLGITHLHKFDVFRFGLLPLILLVFFYIYRMYALKALVGVALSVALADTICYRVLKAATQRPRPLQNESIKSWLRPVGEAHGTSFPSNHAANCFAGAVVLAWYFRRGRYYFYIFAALVAISRPALGVHYPSDILAGALLGSVVGETLIALVLSRNRFTSRAAPVSTEDTDSDDWRTRSRRLQDR